MPRRSITLLALLVVAAVLAACNALFGVDSLTYDGDGGSTLPPGADAGGDAPRDVGAAGDGPAMTGFDVEPSNLQTVKVTLGQPAMPVIFNATVNNAPVAVVWSLDRPALGTLSATPASQATVTPSGQVGGLLTLSATLNGQKLIRQVFVELTGTQNGAVLPAEAGQVPTTIGQLSAGGGVGGVGGEGLGPAVTSATTLSALASPTGAQGQFSLLYPYDKTVFPRGMRAPLLQWAWAASGADGGIVATDAIQIGLATTSGSFTWTGTFAPPTILQQTSGAFVRHPIPQDIWDMATNTAGGPTPTGALDQLGVTLVVARAGQGYGPVKETWTIAPAPLTGSVYYNSYGTQFVKNWVTLDAQGHAVGAAILRVRSGDLSPTLVVGKNSPTNDAGMPTDDTGCRVCHVVSSRGRWLIDQAEQGTPGDGLSFLYDLTQTDVQGTAAQLPQGVFAWAAMTSDGTYALTNSVDPSSSNPAITKSAAGTATSSFWRFGPTPTAAASTGLVAGLAAGYPVYSPDDKLVGYVNVTGQTQNVQGAIVTATYSASTFAFGPAQTIVSPLSGQRVGFPAFLPDDSAIVFETEVRQSQSDSVMVTRNGARSELWWSTLGATPTAARLDALNGRSGGASYLPVLPKNHGIAGTNDPRSSYSEAGWDDTTLDYEPTVLPVVVGGYAWVVFTSRRAYGNQLGSVPWDSWPPDYDTTNLGEAPVKKLWLAAIDLGAAPGTDPSHPAFYLPAQEILAGNSRGFWGLDPCRADGANCETGDQCCNGYCEPNGAGGASVCANAPSSITHCSQPQELCATSADCCDPTNACINRFCAVRGPT